MSASPISGGVQFRGTQYEFTRSASKGGQVRLKITFNMPNLKDSGKYRITIDKYLDLKGYYRGFKTKIGESC